jgi:hypothetical protein
VQKAWHNLITRRWTADFCSFFRKISGILSTHLSSEFQEIQDLVNTILRPYTVAQNPSCNCSLTSQVSSPLISFQRAIHALQSRTILAAKRLATAHPQEVSSFAIDVGTTSGFEKRITTLWNSVLNGASILPGVCLGLVTKAPEVEWKEIPRSFEPRIMPTILALQVTNKKLLSELLYGPLGTRLSADEFCKLDFQAFLCSARKEQDHYFIWVAIRAFIKQNRIDNALALLQEVQDHEKKLRCIHDVIRLVITDHAPKSIVKFLTQNKFDDLRAKDREDIFSDAIASLLILERTQEALQLAEQAPKTQEMSEHLRDYALGLFFREKPRTALKMINHISDRKIRNHTRLQLVKNSSHISMALPRGESPYERHLLIERGLDITRDYQKILRQCVGQGKSADLLSACIFWKDISEEFFPTRYPSPFFPLQSSVSLLAYNNFSRLLSILNDDAFDRSAQIRAELIIMRLLEQQKIPHESILKKALQALKQYYPKKSSIIYSSSAGLELILENLAQLGFLQEAVQEVQNFSEKFYFTEQWLGLLFAKVIGASIESGKDKEAVEMIKHIPEKHHSQVVTKAIIAFLESGKKAEAIHLFMDYLNVFDKSSFKGLFYTFLVMGEREIINKVVTKMAFDSEKYAKVLRTFFTYCLTTDHLDFLPTPGKDIPQEIFDKMKVVSTYNSGMIEIDPLTLLKNLDLKSLENGLKQLFENLFSSFMVETEHT